MEDEDIIKLRLLIDGDCTGDDRRLNNLYKSFLKLRHCEEPEELDANYDRLIALLDQCCFVSLKSELVSGVIQEEMKNYEALTTSSEAQIKEAKEKIEANKKDLLIAKRVRKNRMEYDILAKLIKSRPDRKEMNKKRESLEKELEELQNQYRELELEMSCRQKNFNVLMTAIKELTS